MNYHVIRDDKEFGPYSLADLQQYVAQGSILPTDHARSEGMEQTVEVQQTTRNRGLSPALQVLDCAPVWVDRCQRREM